MPTRSALIFRAMAKGLPRRWKISCGTTRMTSEVSTWLVWGGCLWPLCAIGARIHRFAWVARALSVCMRPSTTRCELQNAT
eukprot:3542820-Pleurochrysis_carterae.AAC.1